MSDRLADLATDAGKAGDGGLRLVVQIKRLGTGAVLDCPEEHVRPK